MAQARASYNLGDLKQFQDDVEAARRIYAEAGDRNGEAGALHNLATGLYDHGERAKAKKMQ